MSTTTKPTQGKQTLQAREIANQYISINDKVDHNTSSTAKKSKLSKKEHEAFVKANLDLDKFYTKEPIARQCYEALKDILLESKIPLQNTLYIEPSAGGGVFLDVIEEQKLGFDIAPTKGSRHHIQKNDFLNDDLKLLLTAQQQKKQLVFLGNPPFGKRSALGVKFLKKAFGYSDIVGFIIPLQFRKWSIQSQINKDAKLIVDIELPRNSFELLGGDYSVGCCFQVWVLPSFPTQRTNLRIPKKPSITHNDFELFCYRPAAKNKAGILTTEKYFSEEWDFAIQCNGFKTDFSKKIYKQEDCDRSKQYMFFKANSKEVLNKLYRIDYFELLKKNSVRFYGFSKADVVIEYTELFETAKIVEAVEVEECVEQDVSVKTVKKARKGRAVKAITVEETHSAKDVTNAMIEEISTLSIKKTVNGFSRQSLYLGTALSGSTKQIADTSVDFVDLISGGVVDIRKTSVLYAIELLYEEAEYQGMGTSTIGRHGVDRRDKFESLNGRNDINFINGRGEYVESTGSLNTATNRRLCGVNNAVYVKQYKSTA